MSSVIAKLKVKLEAEIEAFKKGFNEATKQLRTFQRDAQRIGQSLTTSVTLPIIGIGAAALTQAKRLDQLTKALEAVTGGTDEASKQLNRLRDIAKAPGIDLESAVQGFLTLSSATKDVGLAEKAIKEFGNAVALSAGSTEDLTAVLYSMRELMTDLNQQSLKEINRRIPQFSKLMREAFGTDQAQAIKKMGVTGEQFANIMVTKLGDLQRVTGGFSNSWENASIAVREALAKIGTSIVNSTKLADKLDAFGNKVNDLADRFSKLSPTTQKTITYIAGFAAALGPLIYITGKVAEGLLSMHKAALLLGKGLVGKAGFIGLIVATSEALYTLRERLKDVVSETGFSSNKFKAFFQAIPFYNVATMTVDVEKMGEALQQTFGNTVGRINRGGGLGEFLKKIKGGTEETVPAIHDLTKEVEKFNLAADQIEQADSVWSVIIKDIQAAKDELIAVNKEIDKMAKGFAKTPTGKVASSSVPSTGMPKSDTGNDPYAAVSEAAIQRAHNLQAIADATGISIDELKAKYGEFAKTLGDLPTEEAVSQFNLMRDAAQQAANIIAGGLATMASSVAESVGQLAAGIGSGMDVFRALVGSIADMLIQLGKLAISTGIAAAGIKAALETLNPVAAILGGTALVALGSFVKAKLAGLKPPKLAEGGLAFGKTLATVGDNFNAGSDPEVISPLSKLKSMLGGVGGGVIELRMPKIQWDGRAFIMGWEQAYWQKYRSAPTLIPIKRT